MFDLWDRQQSWYFNYRTAIVCEAMTVTGGGSVTECGRLIMGTMKYSYAYLSTYLLTYLLLLTYYFWYQNDKAICIHS